jgi:rod shape determining protein RodA
MFDIRLLKSFDWVLLFLTLIFYVIGSIVLYSAVRTGASSFHNALYFKQIIWYGIGFVAMLIFTFLNYKILDKWGFIIYCICILLLILVMFFGKYGGGAKRWLDLGFFSFQPSELVKLSVIIMLARYYSRNVDERGLTLSKLIKPAAIVLLPFFLIARQPDLGTAMLLLFIASLISIFVKIEKKTFLYLLLSGALITPIVWFLLKDYQKQRVIAFLNPESDPLGAGYHIIQSKIAIGSGLLTGKGFLKGTQNFLFFLPEQHTDFIFSVLAEQWGFIGSIFVIFLFFLFIFWGLNIAYNCKDSFGMFICVGIVIMIFCQVVINIGMVMGLLPVIGVPLPFISYGGSSVIAVMSGVGILMSVKIRRHIMFD